LEGAFVQIVSERDLILGRVREALRVLAPPADPHDDPPTGVVPIDVEGSAPVLEAERGIRLPEQVSDWLPLVGSSFAEQVDLFARNAADLKAAFHLCDGVEQVHASLRAIAAAEGWRKVASHEGELTNAAGRSLALPTLFVDGGYAAADLESCDVGITGCEALIAQTGTVLVTSRSSGGRVLSALPPHHVDLARRDQLLSDLPAAFAFLKQKYAPDYPSLISFITGPSRTGDIERILVLGAHGPRKVTIYCW
jgi:L-lactate dehydrogenase complex protein LldG